VPTRSLTCGLVVANLGPSFVDATWYGAAVFSPPTLVRLGLAWTPLRTRRLRLTLAPEVSKLLDDPYTNGDGGFGEGLRTTWKAFGVELTVFDKVSIRAGYFEDAAWDRGGLIYEKKGYSRRRVTLWEALTVKNLGRLDKVGFCWGLGIGDGRMFRLDLASDAAVYDFETCNWKLSLTVTDPAALLRIPGSLRASSF